MLYKDKYIVIKSLYRELVSGGSSSDQYAVYIDKFIAKVSDLYTKNEEMKKEILKELREMKTKKINLQDLMLLNNKIDML